MRTRSRDFISVFRTLLLTGSVFLTLTGSGCGAEVEPSEEPGENMNLAGGPGEGPSGGVNKPGEPSKEPKKPMEPSEMGGCESGATAGTIGAEGGDLWHCGALLRVPAGLLDGDTKFSIRSVATPDPDCPFVRDAAGGYEFASELAELPGFVEIGLPIESETTRAEMHWVQDGEYFYS